MSYESTNYQSVLGELRSRRNVLERELHALVAAIGAMEELVSIGGGQIAPQKTTQSDISVPHASSSNPPLPDRIIQFLKNNPGSRVIAEVVRALPDAQEKSVRSTLARLASAGRIEKLERGSYRAVSEKRESDAKPALFGSLNPSSFVETATKEGE